MFRVGGWLGMVYLNFIVAGCGSGGAPASSGPPKATGPNVVRDTQAVAKTAITAADLALSTVTLQLSSTLVAGNAQPIHQLERAASQLTTQYWLYLGLSKVLLD
jgi:hypothetical protein